jgi:hypothetical protein
VEFPHAEGFELGEAVFWAAVVVAAAAAAVFEVFDQGEYG